jgi:hypothetical protein
MAHGADLTPLLTRLKYYTGDYYVLRLSRPLDPQRAEALKAAAEHLGRVQYPYPTTFQVLLGLAGKKTATRHCFQHAAHLLDTAGLVPADRSEPLAAAGFLEVCHEICQLPGRPLAGGYCYAPPVQVIYDVGTLDLGPLPGLGEEATLAQDKTEEKQAYYQLWTDKDNSSDNGTITDDGYPAYAANGEHPARAANGGHPARAADGGHPALGADDGHPALGAGGPAVPDRSPLWLHQAAPCHA